MPIRYRDLSDEQKAILCNGCGPKSGWIPVPDFFFTASCDQHDFNYWLGCTWRDRLKADNQFYAAMRLDAGWNPAKLIICLIFYLAVRFCGAPFFHFADHERDENDLPAIIDKL